MSDPIVLIPARLAATRLPRKPLADIFGEPMIVHVWRRAIEAGIGPVVVAADSPEIVAAVEAAGGVGVLTAVDHPSGTDRLAEALAIVDPEGHHDVVVNVQGDLPTIDPAIVGASIIPLADRSVDIATLCAPIVRPEEMSDPNVVKLVGVDVGPLRMRALYFTRAQAPWGEGPLFHHIGLYAYRRTALRRFVGLPQGRLEAREKLEQLRALEAGMRIDAMIVDDTPLGVDTPHDLERARAVLSARRLN
ncbi:MULTISPECIES: 3-deoxy-manno-octulosonate cytidylyltransferase [Methylobacterium]|uniref:3-deoxy-manno-octulosonate cytidylyltransferase n=1 Tax=Methylobacterium jeotgali TaxID=381630 RepID=A0ABQ4ST32_9HYPH|nr:MULTISPECIES: 3-deoxy-manno-octulosonate cytidylyltransferase [Methylobacterium]PIU04728.1 MAG: 3-deoxy-manno-octulosonate cytidylyltransferase [Methylobacterium sp. CG09_land_8_20_14_0_10_71_15]PIU13431.1 MAG: 3-deoxy-manno-octulosonate cytidylyltransferase [Methylobacterium sp. CG08_land_8_20_14_0_20_71_15]GBU18464.1 3-deoxy-manno-octulosonate cytidylyltransferase [Methylobacterium sp.]GJE04821.1 3-deoxy-manno-octulosonate cytidylyltransferase [Methylobacterium jeotgali]